MARDLSISEPGYFVENFQIGMQKSKNLHLLKKIFPDFLRNFLNLGRVTHEFHQNRLFLGTFFSKVGFFFRVTRPYNTPVINKIKAPQKAELLKSPTLGFSKEISLTQNGGF